MASGVDGWRRATVATLVTLSLVEILWEAWLAPLRPGGSWLALKSLPLIVLLPAIAQGHLRARQWALILLPWYVAEGLVRALSESGRYAICAGTAAALALAAIVTGLVWLRVERA